MRVNSHKVRLFSVVSSIFILLTILACGNVYANERAMQQGIQADQTSHSWMQLAKGQPYVPPQKKDKSC